MNTIPLMSAIRLYRKIKQDIAKLETDLLLLARTPAATPEDLWCAVAIYRASVAAAHDAKEHMDKKGLARWT